MTNLKLHAKLQYKTIRNRVAKITNNIMLYGISNRIYTLDKVKKEYVYNSNFINKTDLIAKIQHILYMDSVSSVISEILQKKLDYKYKLDRRV